ncbi:UNVERIFIED_CONTAM: hypothetical protein FKN15_005533 [Acipenser sinensis]
MLRRGLLQRDKKGLCPSRNRNELRKATTAAKQTGSLEDPLPSSPLQSPVRLHCGDPSPQLTSPESRYNCTPGTPLPSSPLQSPGTTALQGPLSPAHLSRVPVQLHSRDPSPQLTSPESRYNCTPGTPLPSSPLQSWDGLTVGTPLPSSPLQSPGTTALQGPLSPAHLSRVPVQLHSRDPSPQLTSPESRYNCTPGTPLPSSPLQSPGTTALQGPLSPAHLSSPGMASLWGPLSPALLEAQCSPS